MTPWCHTMQLPRGAGADGLETHRKPSSFPLGNAMHCLSRLAGAFPSQAMMWDLQLCRGIQLRTLREPLAR